MTVATVRNLFKFALVWLGISLLLTVIAMERH